MGKQLRLYFYHHIFPNLVIPFWALISRVSLPHLMSFIITNIFEVFPGGYLPNISDMITTMTSGSNGRLTTDSVANIGPHYARTLREWRRNLVASWDVISKELVKTHKLNNAEVELFRRKWLCKFPWNIH